MAFRSPVSPGKGGLYQAKNHVADAVVSMPTPPDTTASSPINYTESFSPNHFKYYNNHLNKTHFNSILLNSTVNLLRILYPNLNLDKLKVRFFIVEVLRRSKTSTQSLQMACFYIWKLIKASQEQGREDLIACPKQLFLGLIILSSKFNQDANYSFKTWVKICGFKSEVEDSQFKNVQFLRSIETKCLRLLNYECYLNGLNYENWCKFLLIFGYDFIKYHDLKSDKIEWISEDVAFKHLLQKWTCFLLKSSIVALSLVQINFANYYSSQLGKKILYRDEVNETSLFSLTSGSKRNHCSELMDEKDMKRFRSNVCN